MVRRLIVLVAAMVLLMPSTVLAQRPIASGLVDKLATGPIDPQVLPNALDDSRQVTVMLEMRGDPVAVVESRAPNRELSKAQRNAIRAELKARQDAIKGSIAARGGRVMSQLQSAYNGIKVRVARSNVASLAELPNVLAVRGIQVQTVDNSSSVPYLGVPGVWESLGFTGDGVKVAVIDTGIDYTHANFGGPGTAEAYELADANDTTIGDAGDAGIFGPGGSSKVEGGWDFVGDDYDASADEGDPALIPHPDPDPLDCHATSANGGHGSHVAGSAAGFGVLEDGSTYAGPYDSTTHTNEFAVGPGVAPEAELYALRVFGCGGSTDVTVDAIEWAVANDMDVINMSLGSSFGRSTDPSAVASTNAAAAGVIVVTSAGNSGPSQYITGSPGTGTGAISTAAVDSVAEFPGVRLALNTGATVDALAANGVVPPDGTAYDIVVLQDLPGTDENESLGCTLEAFENQPVSVEGKLAVTFRNVCARVARAVYGQQAGAVAVAMVNNSAGYPPYEGPISGNPDTGEAFEVTIPFLGIRGADGATLTAAASATTTAITIPNPGFQGFASFTSGGPVNGSSALKPDVAAPGVSIQSTASGTGALGSVKSGTSMASPHVAGLAALVRQARPGWTVEEIKAAIANTADPAGLPGYRVTRAGSGLVSPADAVTTDVVALGDMVPADPDLGLAGFHNSNLSFGFAELGGDYGETRTITVRNHGASDVTLTPSAVASAQSQPASVAFSSGSVTVAAGGEATLEVTLTVPAATAGDSTPTGANIPAFREVSGNVVLTGGGLSLRVPYLLVPRALSDIHVSGKLTPSGLRTFTATNADGVIAGEADVFQWGLRDRNDVDESTLGGSGYDLRAAGVQSFDAGGGDQLIVFALNTHDRWSTAAVNEYDVLLNTTGDAAPDYLVVGFDIGALLAGSFDGRVGSFVIDLATGDILAARFASAPTDSSTILLSFLASEVGLTQGNGGFTYAVQSFSLEGAGEDAMPGRARYNPWNPALRGGFPFAQVAPGGSEQFQLGLKPTAFAKQKPLGAMIVSFDDAAGAPEAQLIRAPGHKKGN